MLLCDDDEAAAAWGKELPSKRARGGGRQGVMDTLAYLPPFRSSPLLPIDHWEMGRQHIPQDRTQDL